MSGLVPFNRRNRGLVNRDYDDYGSFYNMLDDFFSDNWPLTRGSSGTFKIDVQENDEQYLVEADIPGINKEEVSIEMNEGRLKISIQREESKNEESKNYIHKERRYSSMCRNIYLNEAKSEGIKANLENGVLKIVVPKEMKSVHSSKIEIE